MAGVGILQFYTGTNLASYVHIPGLTQNSEVLRSLTRSVLTRVSSTSTHPIEFGVTVAAVFPLTLHLAFHRTRRWELIPAFVIGVAVPLAVSRSAVLVFVVTLIVMMLYWPNAWRRRAVLIAPVAVVALRLAIPGLVGTIYSLFSSIGGDPSVTGRTSDYGVVLGLYRDHPWFGRGLFTFVPAHYRILDNQLLMLLLELGAVGLTAVILLFLIAFSSGLGRPSPGAEGSGSRSRPSLAGHRCRDPGHVHQLRDLRRVGLRAGRRNQLPADRHGGRGLAAVPRDARTRRGGSRRPAYSQGTGG